MDQMESNATVLPICPGERARKNMNDKLRDGTMLRGETHGQHKLTEQQVLEIRKRWDAGGVLMKTLAKEYGVHLVTIYDAIKRTTWRHI